MWFIEPLTYVSPVIFVIISIIIPIYTRKIKDLHLLILLIISTILNMFTKEYLFKPIMKDKDYPIIGQGNRPNENNDEFYSGFTYGMPSGHSQIATVFFTYLVLTRYKTNNNAIILSVLSVLLIMYGRVELSKAHTIQQTIVGSLIGIALSYYYLKYNT